LTRPLTIAALLAALCASAAEGQIRRPRSDAYLFASNTDDVRALWVNPAGLAIVREASVMAEFVLDNPPQESLRWSQWTLAFNSRGFSAGFQQDRLPSGENIETIRVGGAVGFRGGALGGSISIYAQEENDRGGDMGVMYRLISPLTVAALLKNIGRPLLGDSVAALTGVLGLSWLAVPNHLQISVEAEFTEKLENTTRQSLFRAGLVLATGGKLPFGLVTTLDLGSNMRVDAWHLGISVGGNDRVILLGTAEQVQGSGHVSQMSLSGVASRRPPGRRP
jgi:hypothetical protein